MNLYPPDLGYVVVTNYKATIYCKFLCIAALDLPPDSHLLISIGDFIYHQI